MAIYNSYVSLPEGTPQLILVGVIPQNQSNLKRSVERCFIIPIPSSLVAQLNPMTSPIISHVLSLCYSNDGSFRDNPGSISRFNYPSTKVCLIAHVHYIYIIIYILNLFIYLFIYVFIYVFIYLFSQLVSYLYIPSIPVTHLTFSHLSQGTGESCISLASSSNFKAHGHPATCFSQPNLECQRDLTYRNGDVIWYLYAVTWRFHRDLTHSFMVVEWGCFLAYMMIFDYMI